MRMPSRHAELGSASIVEFSRRTRKWTLKRVQGDVARFAAFALTLFATASAANAQPINAPVDYAKDANWLCRPGRADVCARQPVVTALLPSGYGKQVLPLDLTHVPLVEKPNPVPVLIEEIARACTGSA